MNRLALLLAACLLPLTGTAQPGLFLPEGPREPVRVSTSLLVQRYTIEGDRVVQQTTVPLAVFVPVGDRFGLSLRTARAGTSGTDLESLSGFTDTQVAASYYQPAGDGSIVGSLAASLPSGPTALDAAPFATTLFQSQSRFRFAAPSFGQGFKLVPGLTLAYPVGETSAVGLGAAYHFRGGYTPLADVEDRYNPGNELLLTAGFDVRIGRSGAFSTDVSYALYGADAWGDATYDAGSQLSATAQVLAYAGAQEFRMLVRYRNRGGSALADDSTGSAAAPTPVPRQAELRLQPRFVFGEGGSAALVAGTRYFGTSVFFDEQLLFDVGLLPEIAVTPTVRLTGRFIYTFGLESLAAVAGTDPFTGFSAGGGVQVEL